jgi:NAD-dependent dihydropyrimidine dehydrogenase PreA subunit
MTLRYLRDVATLSLDNEKCTGCGKCAEVCPHNVFDITERKALVKLKDLCMECGACALNCPAEAISVKKGVGCALAYIIGWITGSEPACGCSGGGSCC